MRRRILRFLAAVAATAAVGFAAAGCTNQAQEKPGDTGIASAADGELTITGFDLVDNNKYVFLDCPELEIVGAESLKNATITFSKIMYRRVKIPLWDITREPYQKWNGRAKATVAVYIGDEKDCATSYNEPPQGAKTLYFKNVQFINGKATVSFKDGSETDPDDEPEEPEEPEEPGGGDGGDGSDGGGEPDET